MNNVILSGRLGKDPEQRQTKDGQAVVLISIAESISVNSNGDKSTVWHDAEAWGRTGEILAAYAQKGTGVTIQGSLRYNIYDNKDGQRVKRAKININHVEITSNWKQATDNVQEDRQPDFDYRDSPY